MGKYSSQASKYSSNAREINDILNDVLEAVGEIDSSLDANYSKNDYVTCEVVERNETIRAKINEITGRTSSIASSLKSKAKEIDDRIEREEREKKEKEDAKKKTNNGTSSGAGSAKSNVNMLN